MSEWIQSFGAAAVLTLVVNLAPAAEPPGPSTAPASPAQLDKLAGQPVDIAPWGYAWRADRAVQDKPEANFIPRRLERMDRVYRTAFAEMPEAERKSIHYEMPELLKPLLPAPKGRLQAGLVWTGRLADYQVELLWPADAAVPTPDAVEVRSFPTPFGWFGWTVDQILGAPEVSADRRTWRYRSPALGETPVYAVKDGKVWCQCGSATELIAVFYDGGRTTQAPVPSLRLISPSHGTWQRVDVEVEWGLRPGTEKLDFDGSVESYVAVIGAVSPLEEDKGTTMSGGQTWRSRAGGDHRRGIVVPLLYARGARPGVDSQVTVWTQTNGVTFRVSDLERGPIWIPEQGVFVTKTGAGKTGRQFLAELSARNLKNVRRLTAEHREAASWEELMREVRLRTCPAGTAVPPFPKVEDPPMQVDLPDSRWTEAWRAASFQLRGKHMWGGLAFEVGRVAHEMDLVGLPDEADKVYHHFLNAPGAKPDGDYADGQGALEWAKDMRHDMGYSHDGTHASTGRVLFGLAEHYFLTGDKEWFQRHRARIQAAADWIIRQRKLYLEDLPQRQDLLVAGLMPPYMLGDYTLPSCDWQWYYVDNALSLQGLARFADAVAEFDPEAGRKYREEANAFRHDIRRAVERDATLSPVRLGRDGAYHRFIPAMAYARGAMPSLELGSLQRPQCDVLVGALALGEPFSALEAGDARLVDALDIMEDTAVSSNITAYIQSGGVGRTLDVREEIAAAVRSGRAPEEPWFWTSYGISLPKASHNASLYLLQDDVPSFLRFWMNSYAGMVGADGKLWEWGHLGQYTPCEAPDNGTAGWFMENFRNLLAMEEGSALWITRGAPRAWLGQNSRIAVKNAVTYFGPLAYEIVSDIDHGKINATIEIPSRKPPQTVRLRLRHPQKTPIKSATVNGQAWRGFNHDKEVIELVGLRGTAEVVVHY